MDWCEGQALIGFSLGPRGGPKGSGLTQAANEIRPPVNGPELLGLGGIRELSTSPIPFN